MTHQPHDVAARTTAQVARARATSTTMSQVELVRRWQRLLRTEAAQVRRAATRPVTRRPSSAA